MRTTGKRFRLALLLGTALLISVAATPRARACGCFVPPDPTVPVVQAGERILFSMEGGEVVAHIQIQYAGAAGDFGWLLPLPTVPTLELGTNELFNQLIAQTQPKYRLQRRFEGQCQFNSNRATLNGGGGSPAPTSAGGESDSNQDGFNPVVIQSSIGPFDFAVLRADRKDEMLSWLNENRYFVPTGTDDVVDAYIRPGAYFLALKLRSGQSTGDLQPVVVRYQSDLPMIPIVLTSVAAQPNMGIQVWMLGNGRAIPRNYFHTVVNDALIDWQSAGQNYNDVIIKAVGEAPGKHSFVTEYAGASSVMRNILNAPGRFGSVSELQASVDATAFVQYLQNHNYPFNSQVVAILTRYIPLPDKLAEKGITAENWLQSLSYYLGTYRERYPEDFVGWSGIDYQPEAMAQELDERIVQPTLAAGALFDQHSHLTRLYTTLSPQDMNKDPVFSFNPALPSLSNVHQATLTYECNFFNSFEQQKTPARLETEQGFVIRYPRGTAAQYTRPTMPFSAGIQILREEGVPEIVTDNTPFIRKALSTTPAGCSAAGGEGTGNAALIIVVLAALGLILPRGGRSARRK